MSEGVPLEVDNDVGYFYTDANNEVQWVPYRTLAIALGVLIAAIAALS